MPRKRISDDKKRKKISITLDPKVYDLFDKYCNINNIENYSNYIEKIIIEKLNLKK